MNSPLQSKYAITLTVYRRFHRGAMRLFLDFPYSPEIIERVRQLPGARWSKSKGSWYVDDRSGMVERIKVVCRGKAWYDLTKINSQLKQHEIDALIEGSKKKAEAGGRHIGVNGEDFNRYVRKLKARGYSKSTVATYSSMVQKLMAYYPQRLVRNLTVNQIDAFLSEVVVDGGYSNSFHRQMIGAFKLFYDELGDREIAPIEQLVRPSKDRRLPNVLSEGDVLRLLRVTRNLKHRLAFALLYSCGLRVGELINLKLRDIDLERCTIRVRRAKGRKDRMVMLAQHLMPLLQNYLNTYSPVEFLLNGQKELKYSAASVRHSLHHASIEAGITQRVKPHTLRHSFATHLLEQGVDVRYIQELLGHSKPETTMVYTYVANDRLSQISSPLDTILNRITESQNLQINLTKNGE